MEIKKDYSVYQLYCEAWSGAEEILSTIMDYEKEDEFLALFEEVFYDDIPSLTEVNDWLRFDWEDIFNYLGIEGDF